MSELTVLLPAYNEENNIEKLVINWEGLKYSLMEKYELTLKIIVINDGSEDATHKIAKELKKKYDNIVLLDHVKNKGLGSAIKTGIYYIIENCSCSSYTCIMDCDNSHDPTYVLLMLDKKRKNGKDVIIASRYADGATVKGVPFFRIFLSKAAKLVYSVFLKVKGVRDYTCGYRLYNTKAFRKLYLKFGDNFLKERGFSCMVEILYKLYLCGMSFGEIPFKLRYDLKRSKSKLSVVKTLLGSVFLVAKLKSLENQYSKEKYNIDEK